MNPTALKTESQLEAGRPPFVSVIMPVLNEAGYIRNILAAVLRQDYPAFEVIVADGGSSDTTREIVREVALARENVRLIDNPGRIVSTGLNRAIACAKGEIIVRLDGHCEYPANYIRRVVELRERLGADNVGGILVPLGRGYAQRAIAAAYYSPVGVGGPALKAAAGDTKNIREVDAVHGGCWKRERLLQIGGFDEAMVRNQDDELSFRLRKSEGRIFQCAELPVRYHVRDSFKKLFLQFAQYGFWKVRVIRKHPRQASIRHFVPALFVTAIVMLLGASIVNSTLALLPAMTLGFYGVAVGLASGFQLKKQDLRLWPGVALAVAMMHFGYGTGFTLGCLRTLLGPLPSDKLFDRITR